MTLELQAVSGSLFLQANLGPVLGFILVYNSPVFAVEGRVLLAVISALIAVWAVWRAVSIKRPNFSFKRAIFVAVVVIALLEVGLQVYSISPHVPV